MAGLLAAGLILVIAGCSPWTDQFIPTPNPKQALLAEFDRNVATWNAAGLRRYAFAYEPMCFCDTARHLVVGDEDEIRIDGVAVRDAGGPEGGTPRGVPGLFALVRRAIDGDRVTVTYDPATGVPVAMDSDPIAEAIDDELSFKVVDWTLNPPDDALLGRVTEARTRWQRGGISRYTMTINIACSCSYDGRSFMSAVRDGDVVVTSGGRRLDPYDLEGVPLRIDALFDFATAESVNGRTRVEFDAEFGYPTRIIVAPDPAVAGQDEEIEVVVFELG